MDWIRELKDPAVRRADITAGITVALVLVPQSMAYAQLAGLPAHYGLYASFLPVAIASLFGSSRQLATGPVAVVSLLTASALGPLAADNPEAYLGYAVALALLVGLVQLALGIIRLGFMIAFLSHPVVLGFTNAAAIIIATSQFGKLFGVEAGATEQHYEAVWQMTVRAFESPHWPTISITLLALAVIVAVKRYSANLPNVLIAVAITTLVSWAVGFEKAGGEVVGSIPRGLPGFEWPQMDFAAATQLLGVAITIALIGFMEAISIAKTMAVQTRQRLDANQELIGQGLSNLVASCFQGYAVAGSFSRSAVNIESGAVTGFSAVVTSATVGLTLLLLTPLLYHLPQATLAIVIIMAVGGLVKVRPMIHAWKAQKHDGIVALTTFVLTLAFAPNLETGIVAGVLLSLGLYIYRTMSPRIYSLARHPDGSLRETGSDEGPECPKIAILRFEGSLFFANTTYFENKVLERVAAMPELTCIIVDAVAINELDATGEAMLRTLSETLASRDIAVLFARAQGNVMDALHRTGFTDQEGEHHFFHSRADALRYAWQRLRQHNDADCPVGDCQASDLTGCLLQARGGSYQKIPRVVSTK
ncbi:MAG: sulfate permease [Gammaproteobacteria bacterium]|nr:sulfate permease [Gammaproteobacteria bacterium]MYE53200.1 sulfate permease [Gammaproteobacteria bacterium]MYF48548.1 sulfate permease [Gammaproteobacteria bacterium]